MTDVVADKLITQFAGDTTDLDRAFQRADQQATGFISRMGQKLTGQSLFSAVLNGPQSGQAVFARLEKDAQSSADRIANIFQASASSFLKGFAGGFGFTGIFDMLEKAGGGLADLIKQGVSLNQQIERSRIAFTTYSGSVK